jgi:DNA modification methylase
MGSGAVHCVVTSPPYWGLRDYGVEGQIGLEESFDEYLLRLVEVFRGVRRVLREDGTCWVNMGDGYAGIWGAQSRDGFVEGMSATQIAQHPRRTHTGSSSRYSGLKPKDLIGQPWRLAFALQADGWWLRSDIIWSKPNPMPESVTDRPTRAHEYVFLLTKAARYYYDADAVREEVSDSTMRDRRIGTERPFHDRSGDLGKGTSGGRRQGRNAVGDRTGRNLRTVWTIPTQPFSGAHFATYPEKLVEPCIKAGCPEGGTVLDPFSGSGTTGVVALRLGRFYVGIELNPEYAGMSRRRIRDDAPLFHYEEARAWIEQPAEGEGGEG